MFTIFVYIVTYNRLSSKYGSGCVFMLILSQTLWSDTDNSPAVHVDTTLLFGPRPHTNSNVPPKQNYFSFCYVFYYSVWAQILYRQSQNE